MAFELIPEDGTGLVNANSFATLADADAYHDARLHSVAWTAAQEPQKIRALAMATTTLMALIVWQGERTTTTQALAWPRTGTAVDGVEIADNVVPPQVVRATSELARLLLPQDLTQPVAQNDLAGLSLGKGAVALDFREDVQKDRIPSIVVELLQGLGTLEEVKSGGLKIARVSR